MAERGGGYYYIFPTYNQARKVIWDGLDREGNRFMSHFPKELTAGKPNDTEMKLRYKNGSMFRLVGADNIDSIVGTNPIGVVFSEYSLISPTVWGFIRPILAENGGWAIFVFTPRGENHAYDIYELAKNSDDWYCQIDKASQTKVIDQDILDKERREIIRLYGDDALYLQEYECDFTVPIAGAYYARNIMTCYEEGRIGVVAHEPRYVVDTWWDLGMDDSTSIWFTQTIGSELRIIDYLEDSGKGLPHYAKMLQERGYVYGKHTAPHDIKIRELSTGKERIETARTLGINFDVAPRLSLQDGIDSSRALFSKCWFDSKKCHDGINALKSYRKQYDEKRKTYLNQPFHDWSSHAADAFRTLSVSVDFKQSGYRPAKRDPWAPQKERRVFSPDAV